MREVREKKREKRKEGRKKSGEIHRGKFLQTFDLATGPTRNLQF